MKTLSARVWLVLVGLIVLGPVLGVYCTNWVVDPFNRKGFQVFEYERELEKRDNLVLWTLLKLQKVSTWDYLTADVAVVGDSRARWLTVDRQIDAPRVTTSAGHKVVNFGFGGASVEEAMEMFDLYRDRMPNLRLIVFTLPYYRVAQRGPRRMQETLPLSTHFGYYLSRYVLEHSLEALDKTRAAQERSMKALFGGKRRRGKDRRVAANWAGTYRRFRGRTAKAHLRRVREFVRSAPAPVVFWVPPTEPRIRKFIFDSKRGRKRYAWFSKRLGKIGTVYDDFGAPPSIPLTFRDPVHSHEGPRLLERIVTKELGAAR